MRHCPLLVAALFAALAASEPEPVGACLEGGEAESSSLLQLPLAGGQEALQPVEGEASAEPPEPGAEEDQPIVIINQDDLVHRGEYFREHLGMHQNHAGDLVAFLMALLVNSIVVIGVVSVFSLARPHFPEVYSSNTLGEHPRVELTEEEKTGLFGWIRAARRILKSTDHVEASVGLDHCMLLEYTNLAMKILVVVGAPNIFIIMPLHRFFSGDAAGGDHLSALGFGNVEPGSPVCWVHCFVVWFVVASTQHLIFEAQGDFMVRRIAWLKRMPFPRSNTILVECIDPAQCSDARLKEYFNAVFDDEVVESAYVVRETAQALALAKSLEEFRSNLARAHKDHQATPAEGGEERRRPKHRVLTDLQLLGQEVDSINYYSEKASTVEAELTAERARIQAIVDGGGLDNSLFCRSGFVTFAKRVNCEHALQHNFSADMDAFVISSPPDPSDVRYTALQSDPRLDSGREALGYAAALGVFFGFLPLVVAISSITSLENLRLEVPLFDHIVVAHPAIASVWDGIVGSVLLTTLMTCVPTFLVMVFESFFSLKAQAWMQHKVHVWYFYFLVLFVLLVTGIGSSLASVIRDVVDDPGTVFWRISETIPETTHFYLNFFLAQLATHAMFLTRNAPLGKFLALKPLFGAARAKELAEPEDQAYYGIGSRSATLSIMLVTSLVFCTISPLICVLGLVFFGLTRTVHGALFLFAETPKPDLGGVFWVTSLRHTQQGLFIYVLLMVGVLLHRAGSHGPGLVALASLALLVPSYARFDRAFLWERLPFAAVHEKERGVGCKPVEAPKWMHMNASTNCPGSNTGNWASASSGSRYQQAELNADA